VSKSRLFPWVAVAVCAHGAAFAASDRPLPAPSESAPPLEVELAAPTEPDPPPAPAPREAEPLEKESAPAPVARPPAKESRAAARPEGRVAAAAKVGALLTSGETEDNADPVAFLSDPNGGVYGSGVVARGGQAEHGTGPTVVASVSVPSPVPAAESVTPAANLSRPPALDEPDACRGFFPADAAFDSAKVDLVVIVQAGGRVASATIARESPAGEGFGPAARACLLSKRFTPGADRSGRPVTASTAVRVHFTR